MPRRGARYRGSWGTVAHWLGLLLLAVLVFGPLLALMVDLGQSLLAGKGRWLALVIPRGRRLRLLMRSLALAASVAVGGMALGVVAATILWRWRSSLSAALRWLVLALAPIPPYVHALAWSSTTYAINDVLRRAGWPRIPLQGWIGSWWVQLMALAPIAVGLSLVGLESVEPALIDAARLMRSDVHTLTRVALPLAAPAIVAGGGFLFVLSLMDYSVPYLFQSNVYAMDIFAEYSASNQPARALLLALPLLLITAGVIAVAQAGLRDAALRPTWRVQPWRNAPVWPTWFVGLQGLAAVLLVSQIAVPLWRLTAAVGTWENMVSTVSSARGEIGFTFWIALAAALVCLPLALAAAHELRQAEKGRRLWWLLVTAPLAIPAPLVGIGLIVIWNRPLLPAVYGSGLMPVLAALARFTPLAAIVLLVQLRRMDPLLIDAARIVQAHDAQTWVQVKLPMLAPGLLAAASVVFALSTGELAATLIVAPPGQATLTMRIYNYLHYGASDTVAGLCLMMTVSALVAGGLAVVVLTGWSRLFPRAGGKRP